MTSCRFSPQLVGYWTDQRSFLESLRWVDTTYYAKHKDEDSSVLRPGYYPNLKAYPVRDGSTNSTSTAEAISMFLFRYGKKAGISLFVFALSYIPVVGRFVLPAASFYTFNRVAGPGPAAIVFGTGVFLPRKYLVVFLQTYFSSRSMMRELVGHSRRSRPLSTSNSYTHLSLNLTSPAFTSPQARNATGSGHAKDFSLASVLVSIYFSGSHCWVF